MSETEKSPATKWMQSHETSQTRSREEEADDALTSTIVAPWLAYVFILLFLTTICFAVGLRVFLHKHLTGVRPPKALTAKALRDYQDSIQSQAVLTQILLPPTERLFAEHLGVGNEQDYIGRNGRLYYRPDVDYVTGPGFLDQPQFLSRSRADGMITPDPVPAILKFHDDLAKRGIQLVLLPIPTKSMIEPQYFTTSLGIPSKPLQNPSYSVFVRKMEAAGIRICDISNDLISREEQSHTEQYLRTDTHWTPSAMEACDQDVAQFLTAHVLLRRIKPVKYKQTSQTVANVGNIAAMSEMSRPDSYYPAQAVVIHPVTTQTGTAWHPDSGSDILLLGDSFTNIYSRPDLGWGSSAGFAEQLSYDLKRPIDRISLNAGGSYATRQELLDDILTGQNRLTGKKVVVYEFEMSDLSDGDWKVLPIPEVQAVAATGVQSVPTHLICQILAITSAPAPGSTPYPDCVIAARLRPVASQTSQTSPVNILAYMWGLRHDRTTPDASLQPGQIVTVDLAPWQQVEDTYDTYQRIDFDQINLNETVYWVKDITVTGTAPPGAPVPPAAMWKLHPVSLPIKISGNPRASSFLNDIGAKVNATANRNGSVIRGKDGWLFYIEDVRCQCAGQFWGPNASRASDALDPQWADPLPAIVDFSNQLKKAGVELIIVPVPAKTAIYPDKISSIIKVKGEQMPPRIDTYDQQFYKLLRSKGVNVLDLTPLFLNHRFINGNPIYWRQDTHWDSLGSQLAADQIVAEIQGQSWLKSVAKRRYVVTNAALSPEGDLWRMLNDRSVPRETIQAPTVQEVITSGSRRSAHRSVGPVQTSDSSPVVLLGDSYCDWLSQTLPLKLGFPLDLAIASGSGGELCRFNLASRGDLKHGKKLVVWCFSARMFTEDFDWQKFPLYR